MSIKHKKPGGQRSKPAAADTSNDMFMPIDRILVQLASLKENAESFLQGEDTDSIWLADITACVSATALLKALMNEGIRTPEEVLDLLHDYRLQSIQYQKLRKQFEVADVPIHLNAERLCPSCMKKLYHRLPDFCPNCGKKLKAM